MNFFATLYAFGAGITGVIIYLMMPAFRRQPLFSPAAEFVLPVIGVALWPLFLVTMVVNTKITFHLDDDA